MVHLLLIIIYLSFIGLGLPDALLGSAWPVMYQELQVPVSLAGIISMIISFDTILSSLLSDRMTRRFGTGMVTAVSTGMTAIALFGFSVSHSWGMLILWAIPYGLGAGGVDASINNYAAVHYESRHMSWLHCMWGIGASVGPYIMGWVLAGGRPWNMGYAIVSIIQIGLTMVLLFSLPLWKTGTAAESEAVKCSGENEKSLTISEIFHIPGVKEVIVVFFCYCALEQTAGLWASSYMVLHHGIDAETAARYASMFYLGITAGRAISGFLTIRFSDQQMIRLGQGIILTGIAVLLLPLGSSTALAGLILIGLGCAPIYPCIMHSIPVYFGADRSQAVIGVQMASAYLGTCLMPSLFGLVANRISAALYPVYLGLILAVMYVVHERLMRMRGGI